MHNDAADPGAWDRGEVFLLN